MTSHAKEVADAILESLSIPIRETSSIRDLNLPQTPACTVIRREKSLEERLISGGDKHVSLQEGREEKTFSRCVEKAKAIFQQKAAQPAWERCWPGVAQRVNSLRYCFTNKSEDGLPIRRVLHQSPRRPMAENVERNLPTWL